MRWLLDTCVLSEFTKAAPNVAVIAWLQEQNEDELAISVLTVGEIEKGIERLPESRKKEKLRRWLNDDVVHRFEGRILDVHVPVSHSWAKVLVRSEQNGRPMTAIDSLIAATAITHDLTLVTRNVSDMDMSGASFVNPWS